MWSPYPAAMQQTSQVLLRSGGAMSAFLLSLVEQEAEAIGFCNMLLREHPRFCGIIVGQFEKATGKVVGYWNGDFVQEFNDQHMECPIKFQTKMRAVARVRKLNDEIGDDNAHAFARCFWIAPEIGLNLQPLEKYMRMCGEQFPGSPTQ